MSKKCKYDWLDIMSFYEKDHTWKDVSDKYGISRNTISSAIRRGAIKSRPKKETMKLVSKKISEIMTKCHADGRHPGWLSVNLNKENRTHPEQYFLNVINIDERFKDFLILEKVQFSKYVLDFAIPDLCVDIEIDGQYHFYDQKTIEKDKKRNKFLSDKGWKTFRMSWQELQKNAKKVIDELILFLNDIKEHGVKSYKIKCVSLEKIDGESRNFRAANYTLSPAKNRVYGTIEDYNRHRQNNYAPNVDTRKIKWPTKEELEKMVWEKSTVQLAKDLGVSDSAVGKWCKRYGIKKPPVGYWKKKYAGKI